jgi:hypothetical protein
MLSSTKLSPLEGRQDRVAAAWNAAQRGAFDDLGLRVRRSAPYAWRVPSRIRMVARGREPAGKPVMQEVLLPYAPPRPELSGGTAYRFNVYHIMQVDELAPLFPVEIEDL